MITSRRLLKDHGISTTRQRALILKSMRERNDHPDAEAVLASLRKLLPLLSLDTVYRSLNLLAAEGLIRKLALPTHRFHFDGILDRHDHFLCMSCEKIVDVGSCDTQRQSHANFPARLGRLQTVQKAYLGSCHPCSAHPARKGRAAKKSSGSRRQPASAGADPRRKRSRQREEKRSARRLG